MSAERVMLLIDADNVSIDVVEQAVPWVARHFGGPHVRRAYCTAESAVKHQDAFKRLSIRPMVNLAAGKNSTDIALAVDAVDLAVAERPQVIVIASSDSDFAPLVSKLREKGCRVVGIGQDGKTGEETKGVYDDYEVLAHRKAPARAAAAAKAAGRAPAKRAPRAAPAKAPKAAAKSVAKPVPAPAAPALAAGEPPPDAVRAILDALPELRQGQSLELRVAAERLREAGLLGKSASSTKLFGRHPGWFHLWPAGQPNNVHLLAADAARGAAGT